MSTLLNATLPPAVVRYGIFRGPNGMRAGWRLLIFSVILGTLGSVAALVVNAVEIFSHRPILAEETYLAGIVALTPLVLALFAATWIMSTIEGRYMEDYGLPSSRMFCAQFWIGAGISFALLTVLFFVLKVLGVYSFGPIALHGWAAWKYAVVWTVPLFLSALLEDYFYRGYLLFTLTTGIGFWPAAIASSVFIGGMHYFNQGGHGMGPVAVTMYCLLACLVLKRTGDLWMGLGMHAAWNWGEALFYGAPTSGRVAQGVLRSADLHGPKWLTGGGFGPEAGVPNLVLLALWFAAFYFWLKPAAARRTPIQSI